MRVEGLVVVFFGFAGTENGGSGMGDRGWGWRGWCGFE